MSAAREEALRLRREDPRRSEASIAREVGVSKSTARRYLHPEEARADNRRRREAKREWDRANRPRKPCASCGAEHDAGSRLCDSCSQAERREATHERAERIVAWWAEGRRVREIARDLGWSVPHVAQEIHRLRAKGYDLPYRSPTGGRHGA